MKVHIASIVLGFLLLAIAYLILQISIPWLRFEWSSTPVSLTEINPFEPVGYIFAAVGTVFLVFGFTTKPVLRLVFSLAGIAFLIALFKGWIPFDQLKSLLP